MTDQQHETEPMPQQSEKKMEKEAEKNRRELDQIPPPGTDPLHEGP